MISRLDTSQKDFITLLRALVLLRRKYVSLNLLIAGEGSGRQRIEHEVAKLGVADCVTLLGHRNDVADLMLACDCLVFSTFWEGFGLVAAEGLAAGIPVVATDVPALRFVLDSGRAGKLSAPNDPESLAACIDQALSDQEWRNRSIRAGRLRVSTEFSSATMCARYADIWSDVAA